MKKFCVVVVLCSSSLAMAEAVPVNTSVIYYKIGGGKVVGSPASGFRTIRVTANYSAGFGYTCGQFDPHENVSQMINQVQSKVRELPNQLSSAFTAAMLSLPGYLLKREYPGLYGIITKTLDDSWELFDLGLKSCQQMESEMNRMGDGYNPYQNVLRASVADRWEYEVGVSSGLTVDEVKKTVDTDVGNRGLLWAEGVRFGGLNQDPIRFNHDLVVAGYNTLIGRSPTNDESQPSASYRDSHLYGIWKSPREAANFLVEIAGEEEIRTDNSKPVVKAPMGMRPFLQTATVLLQAALQNAVESNDWQAIHSIDSMGVAVGVVEAIRKEDASLRGTMITQMAGEIAVVELLERVQLIERMLNAGLKQADISASKAASTAATYVKNDTLPKLQHELRKILATHEFRNQSLHHTALTILERSAMRDLKAAGSEPPQPINPNILRQTGVPAP